MSPMFYGRNMALSHVAEPVVNCERLERVTCLVVALSEPHSMVLICAPIYEPVLHSYMQNSIIHQVVCR